jgi:hypothetical protein
LVFDFEDGNFVSGIDRKILSTTIFDDDLAMLLNDGVYSLNGANSQQVSSLTGTSICGELIINSNTATNYTNEQIVATALPSQDYRCVKDTLYFKNGDKWYTLDNKEVTEISNTTYFDKF